MKMSSRSSTEMSPQKLEVVERFPCQSCNRVFTTRSNLETHSVLHNLKYCCELCPKSFPSRANLNRHFTVHKVAREFRCQVCGKTFNVESKLKRHSAIHGKDTIKVDNICSLCNKVFKSASGLVNHNKEGTCWGVPKECPLCKRVFEGRRAFKWHMKSHSEKRYICSTCGKGFNQRCHLVQHVMIHTGVKPHNCEHCGKSFSLKYNLKDHVRTHEGDQRPYSCQTCTKKFSNMKNLMKHSMRHTGNILTDPSYEIVEEVKEQPSGSLNQEYKLEEGESSLLLPYCEICSVTFDTEDLLMQHSAMHSVDYPEDEESSVGEVTDHGEPHCQKKLNDKASEQNYQDVSVSKCSFKNYTISDNTSQSSNVVNVLVYTLSEHVDSMNTQGTNYVQEDSSEEQLLHPIIKFNGLVCEVCGKTFKNRSTLKKHAVLHSEKHDQLSKETKGKFVCDVCGKGFKLSSNLVTHQLRNDCWGVPQICQICNRTFEGRRALKWHLKSHSEKKYQCEICERAFAQRCHLVQHTLIHTGEKPHKCDQCGKAFALKYNLNDHMRIHEGDHRMHICTVCGKKFSTANNFKRHTKTHEIA